MKDKLIFAAVVFSACVFIGTAIYASKTESNPLSDGYFRAEGNEINSVFSVEIADTEIERNLGLSGRESLAKGSGMLFVFDEPAVYGFWMKDMNFPIDIIWISGNKIIGWEENVNPEPGIPDSDLKRYYPPEAIYMALEVPAGTVSSENIGVGDEISLQNMVELHVISQ